MNIFPNVGKPLQWFAVSLLLALMSGCGGGGIAASALPGAGAGATSVLPGIAGTAGASATDPTVNSVTPRNLATNVPTSSNGWVAAANVVTGTQLTATFSTAMDPATVVAVGTFTLKEKISGIDVPGTVSMNVGNTVATFIPTAPALTANTEYTVTITTAAKNAGSTAMPNNVAWSFTTNVTALTGQMPVDLLTAGDFAILANTALTCNGLCPGLAGGVTGNIGTTALASITGFTLTPDALNDFATAVEVVTPGKAYSPDYTGGAIGSTNATPAKMVLAGTDLTLAYNDAAGRTAGVGPYLNRAAGALDGLTLTPGVYTWDTGNVTSSAGAAGDITLSGGPDDVWIMQISGYFRPGNGSRVLLSNPTPGGALPQAKNIFWQVAGSDATLGTTAHVEGVILTAGYITLNAGATANSRLLAQTAVTLDGTVTQPAP
ncbi:MAG: ice-binding family protein [Gallionella sp.]|nr:ice-binding family protein [Gallionella sp.]